MMKTYIFRVSLPRTGKTYRKIEVRADQTLAVLHGAIQDAFEFDDDHLYSFFMSGKAWDTKTEYSLPEGYDPYGFVLDDDTDEIEDDDEFIIEEIEPLPPVDLTDPEQVLKMMAGTDDPVELEAIKTRIGTGWREHIMQFADRLADDMAEPRNVLTTTLEQLKLEKGQQFLYLFDYGDEWRFKVKVDSIQENAPDNVEYPRLVESKGKAPQQYPDWDEGDLDELEFFE